MGVLEEMLKKEPILNSDFSFYHLLVVAHEDSRYKEWHASEASDACKVMKSIMHKDNLTNRDVLEIYTSETCLPKGISPQWFHALEMYLRQKGLLPAKREKQADATSAKTKRPKGL